MSVPPTGTVTFLVTDKEGSISLWERNPETLQAALTRYDEILGGFAGAAGMRRGGERAAGLFGAANCLRKHFSAPLLPGDRPHYERQLTVASSPVGEEVWEVAWEEERGHEPRSGHLLRARGHGRAH